MINYHYEIKQAGDYWEAYIYANSDLIKEHLTFDTKNEADMFVLGFLNGIKLGRGD